MMGIGNERGIALFEGAGALLHGHFRLQGGADSLYYVAKDLLWQNDEAAMEEICRGIAEDFASYNIEIIIGPENGAIKYAECTAKILSEITGRPVQFIRARKCQGGGKQFYIDLGDLRHVRGKRTLVVEDVFSTGESAAKVVALARTHHMYVVAVGGVWKRGKVTAADLGVKKFIVQIDQQYPTYTPGEECPACRLKIHYDMRWGHAKNLVNDPLAIMP
ncbi:MAG: phosphoribosyltransferase family protein [Parcubacteria group bacterium]|jgi:orotate phosphoribosyltransferase